MKAAIVMPLAHQRGGAEAMLMHLLRAHRGGSGVEYAVAFLQDGPMVGEAEALGYGVEVFDAGRLRQAWRYPRTVRSLAAWMRRERARVVLSWMTKAHLYAAPAAYLVGASAVWWQHGVPGGDPLDKLATRLPAEAVFCCSGAAEKAQRALPPPRRTRVIYPAVDLDLFDPTRLPAPAEARAALGLPPRGLLVGILARLQRWKGVHVFLDAAARVARRDPEARFVVLGGAHFDEPGLGEELVQQADRSGLSERVIFAGHRTEVPLWLQAMDVVVNASVEPEPFGMTIIEAMALGKAVVATGRGGPTEIVTEGKDGVLVPPGDPEALASAILGLGDPEKRRDLGEEARVRARRFGTARLARETAERLEEVVSA